MTEWWAALSLVEQILYAIAATSSLVLILQLLLNLIGLAGHDADFGGHGDVGVSTDTPDLDAHSSGLGLISFRTVTAFFVGFGWTGIVMINNGLHQSLAIVIATAVGCFFVFVVFYLMTQILGLAETGNIDYANAVGEIGTIYLPVPPGRSGRGQVQIKVQGRLRELHALTDHKEQLKSGTPVKVVEILGGTTMLVKKLESE